MLMIYVSNTTFDVQDVNGTGVIAVETTSETNTVINVNVWILILMEQLEIAKICKPAVLIGLEKAIVPKPTFHTWAKTARNLATFAKLKWPWLLIERPFINSFWTFIYSFWDSSINKALYTKIWNTLFFIFEFLWHKKNNFEGKCKKKKRNIMLLSICEHWDW